MFKDIHIMVPAEIALSEQELQVKAQESLFCALYAEGILTQSQAAKYLNQSIQEFQALLRSRNISHLGHQEDTLNAQLLDVLLSEQPV